MEQNANEEADRMIRLYNAAKRPLAIGEDFHCPVCDKVITKKASRHTFCNSKGKGNCKDRFWSLINSNRYDRARYWA